MNNQEALQAQVNSIAEMLTSGEIDSDNPEMDISDWLSESVLDIEYILDSRKNFIGARLLVAFGGPNIWVNTRNNLVEGYWWNIGATATYTDSLGLHEAVEELSGPF